MKKNRLKIFFNRWVLIELKEVIRWYYICLLSGTFLVLNGLSATVNLGYGALIGSLLFALYLIYKRKHLIGLIISISIVSALWYGEYLLFKPTNNIFMLSMSTDGHYIASTHLNGDVILWDVEKQESKRIAKHANIYSAYFIKNTDDFMWQDDKTNEVIVENINGTVIKQFNPGFPTYGQVMTSDLKHYIASDEDWNLYLDGQKIMLDSNGFSNGKLLNLNLSSDNKYLLTSGVGNRGVDNLPPLYKGPNQLQQNYDADHKISYTDSVVLWNIETAQPIFRFDDNNVKTYAVISPDSQYVITGDEAALGFVLSSATGRLVFELADLNFGIHNFKDNSDDKSRLIKKPSDFKDSLNMDNIDIVQSLKFVDKNFYIRFTHEIPYIILYQVNSPLPLKYLKLQADPSPDLWGFATAGNIDSSWQTHRFVVSHSKDPGITVYQYDPKTQTIDILWTATKVG